MTIRAMGLAAAAVLAAGMVATGADQDRQKLAKDLVASSGIERQTQQFVDVVRTNLATLRESRPIEPAVAERLARAVDAALDAGKMQAAIQADLVAALEPKDAEGALQWLQSPVGKKITALEEAATAPAADGAKPVPAAPPAAPRAARIARLTTALNTVESATDLAVRAQKAIILAMLAILPPDAERAPDAAEFAEKKRPETRAFIEKATPDIFEKTYRTLTDEELDQYIAFAESDVGKKYSAATSAAVGRATLKAIEAMGATLKESTAKPVK